MKLNHINLCTSNVSALSTFLVDHFDYHVIQVGKVPDYDGAVGAGTDFAMLDGADGSSLVLTQIVSPGPSSYPTNFHFGIAMSSPEAVHAKHAELSAAGRGPESIKSFEAVGSSWTAFSCSLGDGMTIEVNHRSLKSDHGNG